MGWFSSNASGKIKLDSKNSIPDIMHQVSSWWKSELLHLCPYLLMLHTGNNHVISNTWIQRQFRRTMCRFCQSMHWVFNQESSHIAHHFQDEKRLKFSLGCLPCKKDTILQIVVNSLFVVLNYWSGSPRRFKIFVGNQAFYTMNKLPQEMEKRSKVQRTPKRVI